MSLTRWEPLQELERLDPLRWQPVRDLEHLQDHMNHLFDRLAPTNSRMLGFSQIPSVELEETDTTVSVKMEIPGVEANELDIDVTDDTVVVRGERKLESKTEDKSTRRSEFQYGKFERMIRLPAHIQTQNVTAEYKNGILYLTLPKIEGEQKKSVKVNVS